MSLPSKKYELTNLYVLATNYLPFLLKFVYRELHYPLDYYRGAVMVDFKANNFTQVHKFAIEKAKGKSYYAIYFVDVDGTILAQKPYGAGKNEFRKPKNRPLQHGWQNRIAYVIFDSVAENIKDSFLEIFRIVP